MPPPDPKPIVANPDGTVSTIAGTGIAGFAGDGGRSSDAQLSPLDLAMSADGALLIADFNNHRIRRLDLSTGIITTVAGNGQTVGANALNAPSGVTVLADGAFLAVAWGEHRVYRYNSDGSRSILVGDGAATCSDAADGDALDIPIFAPRSADVLADGSILVSEQGCHRVRRITFEGNLVSYAGNGEAGYSGDGDDATAATLHAGPVDEGPSFGLSLSPEDPPDELFLADTINHVIRVVRPFTGRVETFAGTGQAGFSGGPPREAQFNRPTHVFVPRDHSLYVVDSGNHAIRYVDPLLTRVTTVAGTGGAGYNGDDLPPAETDLNGPGGVFVTNDGIVFIADTANHRIRLFRLNPEN